MFCFQGEFKDELDITQNQTFDRYLIEGNLTQNGLIPSDRDDLKKV